MKTCDMCKHEHEEKDFIVQPKDDNDPAPWICVWCGLDRYSEDPLGDFRESPEGAVEVKINDVIAELESLATTARQRAETRISSREAWIAATLLSDALRDVKDARLHLAVDEPELFLSPDELESLRER